MTVAGIVAACVHRVGGHVVRRHAPSRTLDQQRRAAMRTVARTASPAPRTAEATAPVVSPPDQFPVPRRGDASGVPAAATPGLTVAGDPDHSAFPAGRAPDGQRSGHGTVAGDKGTAN